MGLDPVIFIGAVAGAGIAGEKNCAFTAEALNVGTAVGINPADVKKIRIVYSIIFSVISILVYGIAGLMI